MKIKKEPSVSELLQKGMKKQIEDSTIAEDIHEEWAIKNSYRENEKLNSKNTTGFKDGAQR